MARLSVIVFILTLLFAPLAFGTGDLWSCATVQTLTFLSLLALLLARLQRQQKWVKVPGTLPLLLLLAFMLVQLIPWPPELLELLSPKTLAVYSHTFIGEATPWLPLTINPQATLAEFVRFASYGAFYVLTVQLLSRHQDLEKTVVIVALLAAAIAFEAIIQKYASPDQIYWLFKPGAGSPTGPWVYRNHFAGFMEMTLPLVLALFLYYRPGFSCNVPLREKILFIFTQPRANFHLLLGFGASVCYISIFVSLSRGGIISSTLSLLLFLLLFIFSQKQASRGIYLAAFLLLSLLAVGWFGWEAIYARFDQMATAAGELRDGRLQVFRDSPALIRDFLFTGSGFGTFLYSYPAYRSISGLQVFDHAHNDYLELLSDGGLLGFILAACFVLTVCYRSWRTIRHRHDNFSLLLFSGVFCGIVALLLHGVTDFNMYNGANGLYFFFLCGLLVAASHTRQHGRDKTTLLRSSRRRIIMPLTIVCLLLLSVTLFYNQQRIAAAMIHDGIKEQVFVQGQSAAELAVLRRQAQEAIAHEPLNADYHFTLGTIETQLGDYAAALAAYQKAIRLNPVNGHYLGQMAIIQAQTDFNKAELLLEAAARLDPDNPRPCYYFGTWLLSGGHKDTGLRNLQRSLALEPGNMKVYLLLVEQGKLTIEELVTILPERVRPYFELGDYLTRTNQLERALPFYTTALNFIPNEPADSPWFYQKVYGVLVKNKRLNDALSVLRRGIEEFPDHLGLRLNAGDLYLKLDIPYRAREEYDRARMIDPGNRVVQQRLINLTKWK